MPQQKISWTYTTRYHLEGEKGLFFPISSRSSVTATATNYPWTIDNHDATQPTTLLCRRTSRIPRYIDVSSRTKHDKAPDTLANRKCYDDLAFSPDPLVNPLFISNLTPTWRSTPGPGHPTLQKQQQVVDGEEIYPEQPPNTPEPKTAAADNRSQSHRPATTDNNDTPPSADSTLLVPAVQLPHVQRMPHRAPRPASPHQRLQKAPSSKPEPKKRQGFFSRLLGSLSGTESSQSGHPQTITALQPVPIPCHHPQSLHRPERPLMPQHPRIARTHAEMSNPLIVPAVVAPAAAAAECATEDRRLRQDLDRIDELDETNPFGQAVHHGGPYEAVSRIVQEDAILGFDERHPRNEAIGTQNLIMSGDVYRFVQLMALQTPLNLRPGQILLHGFAQPNQLDPHPSLHPDYPQPDSDWHRDPQQQPVMNHGHSQYIQSGLPTSESRRLVERPVYPQKAPLVLHSEASLRNLPTMASASSSTDILPARPKTPSLSADNLDKDDTGFTIGMAMMSFGQNNLDTTTGSATFVGIGGEPNSPVPIKIGPHEPADPNEDNPPPYASDFPTDSIVGSLLFEHRPRELPPIDWNHMEDSLSVMPQFQSFPDQAHSSQFVPDPDPAPASSSRHTYWHPQHSQVIHPQPYVRPNRRDVQPSTPQQNVVISNPGLNRSSTYTPGFSGSSTNHHIPAPASLKPISGTLLPSSLRDKESDNRSVQQSVIMNSNVSSRSQAGNPRKNRYLPKHLVMPAPLQPMIQNQATMQQVRFDPQVNVICSLAQAPSPFHAKTSTSNPQLHQAQETQSNGKLRKRSSLFGRTKEPPQPPVTTVSFSANIVPTDRHARGVEKVHKKVLNKKK